MRVLPGVVGTGRRRWLTAAGTVAVAVGVAAVALAGCSQFNQALGQRQAVVAFKPATPVPSDLNSPYALQQLTFRIDHASNADVARLEKCLARFPSVVGVTLQDSSDMG